MDVKELTTQTREEAVNVIEGLRALISEFRVSTVANLYSLAGIPENFMDERWGWTDLESASVSPVSDGYLIVLPKPQPLAEITCGIVKPAFDIS